MKTALLIPGLDALFATPVIRRWTAHAGVREALCEASENLARLTGGPEDLAEFLGSHPRPHVADFERTLVTITAIQVGVVRALSRVTGWDLIVGCSHGDVARSVVSGALRMGDAVDLLWSFGALRKSCPPGRTANLRTAAGTPLTAAQLAWINARPVSVSMWSPFHGTVSGPAAEIALLCAEGRAQGLKIKPLLPYPVHSPVMQPLAATMRERSGRWEIRAPEVPVFSSVWARYIATADEIRDEAIAGALQPLRWIETLEALAGHEGVSRIVNAGPSTTLARWIQGAVRVEEAWELLA